MILKYRSQIKNAFAALILLAGVFNFQFSFGEEIGSILGNPPKYQYPVIEEDPVTKKCPENYQLFSIKFPDRIGPGTTIEVPFVGGFIRIPIYTFPGKKIAGQLMQFCVHSEDIKGQVEYQKKVNDIVKEKYGSKFGVQGPNCFYGETGPEGSKKCLPYQTILSIPCAGTDKECPSQQTPSGYVGRLYRFALMIAGLIGFGAVIFGAFQYTFSAGNIFSQQEAKETITQALIGILLLVGAVLILNTIDPRLSVLKNPVISREIQDTLNKRKEEFKQKQKQIEKCDDQLKKIGLSGSCEDRCGGDQVYDIETNKCKSCPNGYIKQLNECVPQPAPFG